MAPETCTYRQADFWIRKGYVDVDAPGSGNKRMFSNLEWDILELMGDLVNVVGLTPQIAAQVARDHFKTLDEDASIEATQHTFKRGINIVIDDEYGLEEKEDEASDQQ